MNEEWGWKLMWTSGQPNSDWPLFLVSISFLYSGTKHTKFAKKNSVTTFSRERSLIVITKVSNLIQNVSVTLLNFLKILGLFFFSTASDDKLAFCVRKLLPSRDRVINFTFLLTFEGKAINCPVAFTVFAFNARC